MTVRRRWVLLGRHTPGLSAILAIVVQSTRATATSSPRASNAYVLVLNTHEHYEVTYECSFSRGVEQEAVVESQRDAYERWTRVGERLNAASPTDIFCFLTRERASQDILDAPPFFRRPSPPRRLAPNAQPRNNISPAQATPNK
jgi:hypothetical protein